MGRFVSKEKIRSRYSDLLAPVLVCCSLAFRKCRGRRRLGETADDFTPERCHHDGEIMEDSDMDYTLQRGPTEDTIFLARRETGLFSDVRYISTQGAITAFKDFPVFFFRRRASRSAGSGENDEIDGCGL